MWLWSRKPIWVGVGADRVAWGARHDPALSCAAFEGGFGGGERKQVTPAAGGASVHAGAAIGGASARRRGRARVVASSQIARHWIVDPPSGVRSLRELRAVAAACFSRMFGSPADAWSIAGDWRSHRPFLCAAVPRVLVESVNAVIAGGLPHCDDVATSTTLALRLRASDPV